MTAVARFAAAADGNPIDFPAVHGLLSWLYVIFYAFETGRHV